MTHNPMDSLKRRPAPVRHRFPNERYATDILQPGADAADNLLFESAVRVHRARVIDLVELRSISADDGRESLVALQDVAAPDAPRLRPLEWLEGLLGETAGGQALLGSAPEEVIATAMRMVLRERLLEHMRSVLALRNEIADLALGHLTTLVTLTSNGQMIQPTTLAHYLTGQIGPLSRATQRMTESYSRLNRSPLGSVSGVSTAIPVRRERLAELLGFDAVQEHTFDALAAADVEHEIASLLAGVALETMRFVSDLSEWARDDAGAIVPSEEFVHGGSAQPQRRDPQVLDHLRSRLSEQAAAAQAFAMGLTGRAMLPGAAARLDSFLRLQRQISDATVTAKLLAGVISTLEVNRALAANRAHKGFATSSELADLLAVDEGLSRTDAYRLAERIATEASILALGGMTLDTKLVDKLALEVVGREIGIETETLGKCLSVRRFVERREVPGGPAPAAVREMIEREKLLLRRDHAWLGERIEQLSSASAHLDELVGERID